MLCSRREWLLVGVLLVAFRQTVSQDIQQLVDNPTINAGSDVSLQVTAATADLAAGTWYLLASPSPVRQLPNNDRTRYSVSGLFHRLTISNVVASDEGRYYYVHGQGVVTQGAVTVATQAAVSIIGTMGDVTALEGSNSSMTTTVSTEGVTNGVWKQGTTVLTNAAGYTITTSGFTQTLDIQNVQTTQAGTYIYTVGGASTQATLTVVGRLGNVTGSVGIDVSFTLNVFPGNAGGSWSRNNVQIADSSKYQITQSSNGQSRRLLVRNAQTADAGAYVYSVNGQQSSGFLTVGAAFSPWTAWTNTSCAVTCGTAVTRLTSRTRTCLAGSGQCDGETFESRLINCQLNQCPINGGVSLWGSWSPPTCTQICGVGATGPSVRTRTCSNPSTANGGLFCSSPLSETSMRPCNLPACTGETAAFSTWTAWTNTSCAVTCGTAITRFTSRTRTCLAGSGQCDGATFESRLINCQLNQCPIDGGFSMWGVWQTSACPVTCGTSATKLRTRSRFCSNPAPQFGGRNCTGPFAETQQVNCNLTACQSVAMLESNPQTYIGATISLQVSVPGPPAQALGAWYRQSEGVFNVVTATARTVLSVDGNIHQLTLINVTAEDAGTYFYIAAGTNTQGDLTIMSPVHGGISQWGPWNNPPCPVTCGQGIRSLSRNRTCTEPVPQFGGRTCSETKEDTIRITCSLANCPIDGGFSMWGVWQPSACPVTCGTSATKLRTRSRFCSNPAPQFGGRNCTGPFAETQQVNCNLTACQSVAMLESNPQTYIGATISLQVSVPGPPAQALGAWYRQSEGVFNVVTATARTVLSVDGNIHQLTLINVTAEDAGTYFYIAAGTNTQGDLTIMSPVHGGISQWGPWNNPPCPVTCGQGIRSLSRNRTCTEPVPQFGGRTCSETKEDTMRITCSLANCPIDGGFSMWGVWQPSACPVTCGTSATKLRTRSRFCSNPAPQFGGRNCTGQFAETQQVNCNLTACQSVAMLESNPQTYIGATISLQVSVPGPPAQALGAWYRQSEGVLNVVTATARTVLSVDGNIHRLTLINVTAEDAGIYFYIAAGTNTQGDLTIMSPVHGGISQWGPWNNPPCPVTCGQGIRSLSRNRTCTQPVPQFGGRTCSETKEDTMRITCSLANCPVDGGYSPWSQWSNPPCSGSCGNLSKVVSRVRTCSSPSPQFGGRQCVGSRTQTATRSCNLAACTGCPEATIYFVVDQSQSVGTENFQLVKAALNSFVSSIISRNNNIRVGVIGFSSNVTSFIRDTSDISLLQAAINFTLTPPNGGTNTHLGIRRATQNLNQGTSNYPRVMVVITDGLSNLPNETRVAAAEARNSGITVFAVGVLALNIPSIRQRFQAELLSIASSNATAIEIANFNVLTNSLNNISQILCRGTVNGNWASWGPWSDTRCSGTCGTSIFGTANRTRTCTNPAPSLNGNSCVGNSMEVIRRNCGFNPCPINGSWSVWTQWSTPQCTALCGSGVMATVIRRRTCTNPSPSFGGNSCQGNFQETELKTCGLSPCDGEVNGGFGQWNAWTVSPCSATCGRNVTRMLSRQRLCNNPAPANGGRDCIGPRNDTSNQLCSVPECQGCPEATIYFVVDQSESVRTADFQLVKAALNSFVSSIISRNNNIRVGVIGFSSNVTSFIRDTSDISSLQAAINFTLTPPNGGTSTHLGIRRATQYLNQGTSNYPRVMVVITDGLSNLPNETRVAAAEARNSGITVFAVGVLALNFPSIRQRFQAELLSIASSNTTAIEIANFNVLTNSLNNISQILCRGTVNGNWASWGPWSDTRCSGTCGLSIMGTSNRTRTCTDPAPSLNGNSCVGNNMEVIRRNCGFNPCPINGSWSVWTQWSTPQCTALCGSGVMATVIRRRTCTNPSPSFGGNSCQGNFQETELKTCGLSPCDGEVNGGFGQWNSWTVSPCSATCGRNVTRMLSRQRLCNNPAPANGGRDCIGPRNDTSNQLCSVPECQVTALCDDVKKQYGVGYRYHPTDCDKYIQCYDNPRGIAIGVYRSCPFGYYWNQDTFRCTESWKVDCPLERCKGSCGASYKMAGSCRSYWKCDDGKSVARCCPRGFSFSPGDGCYFNLYCDDECPSLYVSRDVCDKHPNWGNTNSYNISLGDLGWRSMSCPANSFFNILDCGCTQVSPATCAASYDFVAGTRPSWVQLEQVNNRVGALSLTNKSKVHLDIKMTVADSPIVFTFTYRETVVSNKSRVLASSKDRLVVSTEPKGVLFTITSWYGDVTRMILSTDGMPLNEWKTVSVMYTCKYLVGTVSNNNVKYMDRVLVKDTNILSDGLTIGSDASRVPGMPFVGDVGRVSVYKCDPGILV